jgi:uncharacterized protein (TIGR02246 family)
MVISMNTNSAPEIVELLASVDAAWNAGDATAFAALWTTDGTVISPQGQRTEGRDQIEREQAAGFAGPMKGTTHTLTAAAICRPANGVAVVDGEAVIANLRMPDGTTFPPLSANFTTVCVDHGGTWSIAHMVSYMFMSQ